MRPRGGWWIHWSNKSENGPFSSKNEAKHYADYWHDQSRGKLTFKIDQVSGHDERTGPRPSSKESRRPSTRESRRSYSMTYGTLPPYEKFIEDIRRPNPDYEDQAYWPEGTLYPMELVDDEEIALAEGYGGLQPFTPSRYAHKSGFRGDEQAIYGLLQYLADEWNNGSEPAGDLASSIMTTLGYEWI